MDFDSEVERDAHLRAVERVLTRQGWSVKLDKKGEPLKYPYAVNPDKTVKIWFRKKSVLAGPFGGQMNEARSLGVTTGEFVSQLQTDMGIKSLNALSRCF